jgi:arsenate reductase (thioredoxin)
MTTRVLILCTANSARSQMAEGLLREIGGEDLEIYSAGSKPSQVNPYAIQAMEQRGIDIRQHTSDSLTQYLDQAFDYVITVCDNAAETCPVFPGKAERIHWSFPDPAAITGDDARILQSFIDVRDGLETRLRAFVAQL